MLPGIDPSINRRNACIAIAIVMVLMAGAFITILQGQDEEEGRYAIIATNDLHSYIQGFIDEEGDSIGGLDRIASCVDRLRSSYPSSLLVSSGDDVAGYFYDTFHGIPETSALSLIGYDVATIGNHEFDYGLDTYRTALSGMDYEVVSSNLEFDDYVINSTIDAYCILPLGDLMVGFFGLTTPTLPIISDLDPCVEVKDDVINITISTIAELERCGADIIVLLSHCGVDIDTSIAQNVSGIDLIVGGHDHLVYQQTVQSPDGWTTRMVQSGCYGEYLSVLSFGFDGHMENVECSLLSIDDTVGSNENVMDLIEPYVMEYDAMYEEPLGVTDSPLDARYETIRRMETNLGDLVADSILERFPSADIALINSGSIRGDTVYPSGNITLDTISSILPYEGIVYLITMTGADIVQALEISAATNRSSDDGWPGDVITNAAFLQVSGIRFVIDTNATPFCASYDGKDVEEIFHTGERVGDVQICLDGNWTDIDLDRTYTVATSDYLKSGGDGYYVFNDIGSDMKVLTSVTISDILADHVRAHSPLSVTTDQRIVVL